MPDPRDITQIPAGPYCYQVVSADTDASGVPVIKTQTCPYWQRRVDAEGHPAAYCSYLGEADDLLLLDQCKICEINWDDADTPIA